MILRPENVKYIVVHCSATPPDLDIGAAEIDKWHRRDGWDRIGYALVIRRSGEVEKGRGLSVMGAHAKGFNSVSVGICLVGGVTREDDEDGKDDADGPRWDLVAANNFTPQQFTALYSVLHGAKNLFPQATIIGHRDLPGVRKQCPSFDVRAWCKEVGL